MDAMIVKKIPPRSWNPRANYCVHKWLQQSIFWVSWIMSTSSNSFYLKSTLKSSSHLCKVFWVLSFLQVFPQNPCTRFSSPMHAIWPTHLILLHLITITKCCWGVQVMKLLLTQFAPHPVTCSSYVESKVHTLTGHEGPGGVEVELYSFLNLGTRWEWVVNATPWPFYPQERDPVPIV